MAEPLIFNAILNKPAAYGNRYIAVPRAAHTTQRFKFDGRRGETGSITAISFHPLYELAYAAYQNLEATSGFEVVLTSLLQPEIYTGLMGQPTLEQLQKVERSVAGEWWILRVSFPFTRTEGFA